MADHFEVEIQSLQLQLEKARDEAELNLLQRQQVQEELEFYFLAHQRQSSELERYQHLLQATESLVNILLEKIEKSG